MTTGAASGEVFLVPNLLTNITKMVKLSMSDEKKITVERLREVVNYDPIAGSFTWKIQTARAIKIGSEMSPKPDTNGYRYLIFDKKSILAQKAAWMIMTGSEPVRKLTFDDKNPLNLKWENIKETADHTSREGKKKYLQEYRKANPEKEKARGLRDSFGISIEQFNQMLLSQKGCCSICDLPETASRNGKIKALAVDHDHETGVIRSLLCTKCNVALGAVNDSEDHLQKMISYLKKHRETPSNVITLAGRK